MDTYNIFMIVTLVIIVLMILSGAWFINSLIILIRLRMQEKEIYAIHKELEEDNSKITTEYSEKLIEFTKMLTTQIAILQFRTFQDGHDLSKITKANVKVLAEDIAKTVKSSIKLDNIDFSDTLFTRNFLESYIIETSIITVKALLDKAVGED